MAAPRSAPPAPCPPPSRSAASTRRRVPAPPLKCRGRVRRVRLHRCSSPGPSPPPPGSSPAPPPRSQPPNRRRHLRAAVRPVTYPGRPRPGDRVHRHRLYEDFPTPSTPSTAPSASPPPARPAAGHRLRRQVQRHPARRRADPHHPPDRHRLPGPLARPGRPRKHHDRHPGQSPSPTPPPPPRRRPAATAAPAPPECWPGPPPLGRASPSPFFSRASRARTGGAPDSGPRITAAGKKRRQEQQTRGPRVLDAADRLPGSRHQVVCAQCHAR